MSGGKLAGRVAVLTGAAAGIGRAGAIRFAAEGARLVLSDIDEPGLDETLAVVRASGTEATAVAADITTGEGNEDLVRTALTEYGQLDVFWANAGFNPPWQYLTEIEESSFDRLMATNVKGPWLGARAASKPLSASGHGSFVITASLGGLKARQEQTAYQASKGGAVMLVRTLSKELAPLGIRVNAVCPGPTATEKMQALTDPERQKALAAAIPLGRVARPEEMAAAALFLASDESSFITGVNLPVDGGLLA